MKKTLIFLIAFTVAVATLSPNTTYASYTYNNKTFTTYEEFVRYVKAYMEAWRIAHNKTNTSTSSSVQENTSVRNRVEVETRKATDVNGTSVRLVGDITFKKSDKAKTWFDYGTNRNYLIERTTTEVLDADTYGDEKFDVKVQNLQSETTYYYRAGAVDEDGNLSYGEIRSFTTDIDTENSNALVSITTSSATSIDDNRATFRATINFRNENVAYVWFDYGEDEDDLDSDTRTVTQYKEDGKTIELTVKGLEDAQEYYYRAVIEDNYGERAYGKTVRFTTRYDIENEKPTLTTGNTEDVGVHTATLTGDVDMNDFKNGIVFFLYAESTNEIYDIKNNNTRYSRIREQGDALQKVLLDDDLDNFYSYTHTLTNLDLGTTHYYAIAVEYEDHNLEDDTVVTVGAVRSFRTSRP